jgi:cysteine desulfurase
VRNIDQLRFGTTAENDALHCSYIVILLTEIRCDRDNGPLHALIRLYVTPLLYFDHNATTPPAAEVIDAYTEALREVPGNASSTHSYGQVARQQMEAARNVIARSLACSPREVVFTSGGTESNNLALFGLARKHVVTTTVEHPSVFESCRHLARQGIEVTFADPDIDAIAQQIRPETFLISVMHANNETGTIQPLAEIGRLVRERRAAGQELYLHSDGVQAFGKVPVDVSALGVDLYSVTAHKLYGPKGVGALYVKQGVPLHGIQLGGRHEREKRAGTENVPGAVAFARAAELLANHSASDLHALRDRFEHLIFSALDNVEINGNMVARLPNTSNLLFRGVPGETLLIALDTAGFAVSTGSACTSGSIEPSHVLLAIGRTADEARSSVRFSFGRTNTEAQVDLLCQAVVEAVTRIRKRKETGRPQLVAH